MKHYCSLWLKANRFKRIELFVPLVDSLAIVFYRKLVQNLTISYAKLKSYPKKLSQEVFTCNEKQYFCKFCDRSFLYKIVLFRDRYFVFDNRVVRRYNGK